MLYLVSIAWLVIALESGGVNEPNPVEDERVHTVWSTYTPGQPTVLAMPPQGPQRTGTTPDQEGPELGAPSADTPTPEGPVRDESQWQPPLETPSAWCCFVGTRYGESYNGKPLGCSPVSLPAGRPDNLYHSVDSRILAASPAFYQEWECGKYLLITNLTNGRQLVVVRVDSCPGCGDLHIDLSEAGMAQLCGVTYPQTCDRLTNLMVQECKEENIVGSCFR